MTFFDWVKIDYCWFYKFYIVMKSFQFIIDNFKIKALIEVSSLQVPSSFSDLSKGFFLQLTLGANFYFLVT